MAMTNPKGRVNYEPNSWSGPPDDNREPRGPRADAQKGFNTYAATLEDRSSKVRVRSETFADHFSQARQFYISQTPLEQTHIADALTFELSKVVRVEIRERMVGHLRNIDDGLAKNVADGLGLEKLPAKIKPLRDPIPDLPASSALSILANGPGSFKGRKLGIFIAEGGDAKVVAALEKAAMEAGAVTEIIAPHVGGAKLSDGKLKPANQKIDGGPSVVYDAVALVMSEAAAKQLGAHKPSTDFVNDAFAHAKFIAYTPTSKPLLQGAGVADRLDDGCLDVSAPQAAKTFIEACGKLRFWDRATPKKV